MRSSMSPENSSSAPSTSRSSPPLSAHQNLNCKHSNVFQLLTRREVSPRTKRASRKFWGENTKCTLDSYGLKCEVASDARRGLISW